MSPTRTTVWSPWSYVIDPSDSTFGLIILNAPIRIKKNILLDLWNKAKIRVTVDGGTDQWLQWLENTAEDVANAGLPNLVTGDFDSIRPETLTMLQEKAVKIVETSDQDHTDFTKAVRCLQENTKVHHIIVVSEISGRMDQVLSQLNTLFSYDFPIILLSSCCATWLLKSGCHEIHVEKFLQSPFLPEDQWVGLIPVGAPATVTSSGLKWNLENTEMKFGGIVSSSNTYNGEPAVRVSTNQPLVWSMGLSTTCN